MFLPQILFIFVRYRCTNHAPSLIVSFVFRPDKFCSYIGLIPSTFSSGEKEVVGKITRRSNKPLRSSIIEASWVAIRHDPALTLKYNELRSRMEPNESIIRIAKKLLNRIRYVLKNEQEYVSSII